MFIRNFNLGIDFSGGNAFQLPVRPGVELIDVRHAVEADGITVSSAQTAGRGSSQNFVVKTDKLTAAQQTEVKADLAKVGKVTVVDVSASTVSQSWGNEVTTQALWALLAFLVAVSAFIWVRFQEWRMAAAALLALLHDLVLTAGVYSLVGFEVTPATVVGLLTILGFSLYDTVVVFDKVSENARGLLSTSRYTYGEAANLAVNQTLMRSINTSIIGLLPVAGLLFVGAGLLGVGTLQDLALVLFVGMLTGAYSSLFLATPWLVDLKMLDPRYRNHATRVAQRRVAQRAEADRKARAVEEGATEPGETDDVDDSAYVATAAPRPGAKPAAKRGAGARPGGNRPGPKRPVR
jgi:preprotein translocase subunit SecF